MSTGSPPVGWTLLNSESNVAVFRLFGIMLKVTKVIVLSEAKSRRNSSNTALNRIYITSICFFVPKNIELDGKQKTYMKLASRTLFHC